MVCILKPVMRFGVIAGLAGGAALLVAGPDRVGAALSQMRGNINEHIDSHIQDPVALRAQLRKLAEQYPERIADVRGDLAELRNHTQQVERDMQIASRVVELAEADLHDLRDMLARAEDAQGQGRTVRVSYNGGVMDVQAAYRKANQVLQTRDAYAARVDESERDLAYMQQQDERLTEILGTLEREQAEFQTQLFQLDRQVDAVARNERLLDILEDRQETIEKHTRYEAASLDQVKGRLGDIRSKQEARMQALASGVARESYEDRAKVDIDNELRSRATLRQALDTLDAPKAAKATPEVYYITPGAPAPKADDCEVPEIGAGKPLAARPIVIE
jgi:chromosome segregation ATPase